MYSHHSGDVMFTRRTLLTITETQICGDGDRGSSKLTEFSYWSRHLSWTDWPHAITLPVTLLQQNTTKRTTHMLISIINGTWDQYQSHFTISRAAEINTVTIV